MTRSKLFIFPTLLLFNNSCILAKSTKEFDSVKKIQSESKTEMIHSSRRLNDLLQNTSSWEPSFVPSLQPNGETTTIPTLSTSTIPTYQPSITPSLGSTSILSSDPSAVPSLLPSVELSNLPSLTPTNIPSSRSSAKPSTMPSLKHSMIPTEMPSYTPSHRPSDVPSRTPSFLPSSVSSSNPSLKPSLSPSATLSTFPTKRFSFAPSIYPTSNPSFHHSSAPSLDHSLHPSYHPSVAPSSLPSNVASSSPSKKPSIEPSFEPSKAQSLTPSRTPSMEPSFRSSSMPSSKPSASPTLIPSFVPSHRPSNMPSWIPSIKPSFEPSHQPSSNPSVEPSLKPSSKPSVVPTHGPTLAPSHSPTSNPSLNPSFGPSSEPSLQPSISPTVKPSSIPSQVPSKEPSAKPSAEPSFMPSLEPSKSPSAIPSSLPSKSPSNEPSLMPSPKPSTMPSSNPSAKSSIQPTLKPFSEPSALPTMSPTNAPSFEPSHYPTSNPSLSPSSEPSIEYTMHPSNAPSDVTSNEPSAEPIGEPSLTPSSKSSETPSELPSSIPSFLPSNMLSLKPSTKPGQALLLSLSPSQGPSDIDPILHLSSSNQVDMLMAANVSVDLALSEEMDANHIDVFQTTASDFLQKTGFRHKNVTVSNYSVVVISQQKYPAENLDLRRMTMLKTLNSNSFDLQGRNMEEAESTHLIVNFTVFGNVSTYPGGTDFDFLEAVSEVFVTDKTIFFNELVNASAMFEQLLIEETVDEFSIIAPEQQQQQQQSHGSFSTDYVIIIVCLLGAFIASLAVGSVYFVHRRNQQGEQNHNEVTSTRSLSSSASSQCDSLHPISEPSRPMNEVPYIPSQTDAVPSSTRSLESFDEMSRSLSTIFSQSENESDDDIITSAKYRSNVSFGKSNRSSAPPSQKAAYNYTTKKASMLQQKSLKSKYKGEYAEATEIEHGISEGTRLDNTDSAQKPQAVSTMSTTDQVQVPNKSGLRMFSCFGGNPNSLAKQIAGETQFDMNSSNEFEVIHQAERDSCRENKLKQSVVASLTSFHKTTCKDESVNGLKEIYEVRAPQGALGIVIDSTPAGPKVHSVKPNSPLLQLIDEDDIIIGVDGIDTRSMTSVALSKLMGRRQNKDERILTLLGKPLRLERSDSLGSDQSV